MYSQGGVLGHVMHPEDVRYDDEYDDEEEEEQVGAYTRSLSAQLELSLCPTGPNLTHECVPNVLKLTSEANEFQPLVSG
jgi:hypothetical protein